MNTTLQVPVKKQLKDMAATKAKEQGFSSLQEAVRVFLNMMAQENIRVGYMAPSVKLSEKNDRKYAKMVDEVKSGKTKTKSFSDASSLIEYLHV